MKLHIDIDISKLSPRVRKKLFAALDDCADELKDLAVRADAPPPTCGPGEPC